MKAIIFDMDGVLSHTEKLHAEVKSRIVRESFGVSMSASEISERFAGMMEEEMFRRLISELNLSYGEHSIRTAVERKWRCTYEILESTPPRAIPCAIDLVEHLAEGGFTLGVASGAPLQFIEYITSALGIRDRFHAIASSGEVDHGKPSPDVFLLCAERLGKRPEDCIVIEDSKNGMIAARAAGMRCIGLVEEVSQPFPTQHLVRSLGELIPFPTIG